MADGLELPTRSRGWGKTEVMVREMARIAAANMGATWVFNAANRTWSLVLSATLTPAPVKPAFRGRRHGW